MSKKVKIGLANPGDIVLIKEHEVVQYPGSESKGICRYLVVNKQENIVVIYRIRSKSGGKASLYIPIGNYSVKNKTGYLSWTSPYALLDKHAINIQGHSLPLEEFIRIKKIIFSNRKTRKLNKKVVFKAKVVYNKYVR